MNNLVPKWEKSFMVVNKEQRTGMVCYCFSVIKEDSELRQNQQQSIKEDVTEKQPPSNNNGNNKKDTIEEVHALLQEFGPYEKIKEESVFDHTLWMYEGCFSKTTVTVRLLQPKAIQEPECNNCTKKVCHIDKKQYISIVQELSHPFIVVALATRTTPSLCAVVVPCYQKSIKDIIESRQNLRLGTDSDARFISACLTDAVLYLHEKFIIHRNICPYSVYINHSGDPILGNFEQATIHKELGVYMYGQCGTVGYQSPEVVAQLGYNHTLDYWGIGCVAYEFLFGIMPYVDADVSRMLSKTVLNPDFAITRLGGRFSRLPKSAQEAIRDCFLNRYPHKRVGFKLHDVKQLRWFQPFRWDMIRNREYDSPLKKFVSSNDSSSDQQSERYPGEADYKSKIPKIKTSKATPLKKVEKSPPKQNKQVNDTELNLKSNGANQLQNNDPAVLYLRDENQIHKGTIASKVENECRKQRKVKRPPGFNFDVAPAPTSNMVDQYYMRDSHRENLHIPGRNWGNNQPPGRNDDKHSVQTNTRDNITYQATAYHRKNFQGDYKGSGQNIRDNTTYQVTGNHRDNFRGYDNRSNGPNIKDKQSYQATPCNRDNFHERGKNITGMEPSDHVSNLDNQQKQGEPQNLLPFINSLFTEKQKENERQHREGFVQDVSPTYAEVSKANFYPPEPTKQQKATNQQHEQKCVQGQAPQQAYDHPPVQHEAFFEQQFNKAYDQLCNHPPGPILPLNEILANHQLPTDYTYNNYLQKPNHPYPNTQWTRDQPPNNGKYIQEKQDSEASDVNNYHYLQQQPQQQNVVCSTTTVIKAPPGPQPNWYTNPEDQAINKLFGYNLNEHERHLREMNAQRPLPSPPLSHFNRKENRSIEFLTDLMSKANMSEESKNKFMEFYCPNKYSPFPPYEGK